MKTFNVIKKNRKYFAATQNGYKCKILIDENSQNLELGEQALVVDDISVRTKYGTDVIFRLSAPFGEQKEAGICTLQHHTYNALLVKKCKKLGGNWDGGTWVFSDIVEHEVEDLDYIFNSNLVAIEITAQDDIYEQPEVSFGGYPLAKATDRDSGATIRDGISVISGDVTSGGSRKNWACIVRECTVIRMKFPSELLNELDKDGTGEIEGFKYKVL